MGNYSSEFHRKNVSELALTKGCLDNICVGQEVIPDSYVKGHAVVKGINFYTKTFVVLGDYSSEYHRKTSSQIAFKRGCLHGICVGDTVLPDTYVRGYAIVKAINFSTQEFIILGNYSSEYQRKKAEAISIIDECTDNDSSERYKN